MRISRQAEIISNSRKL